MCNFLSTYTSLNYLLSLIVEFFKTIVLLHPSLKKKKKKAIPITASNSQHTNNRPSLKPPIMTHQSHLDTKSLTMC